MKKQIFNVFLLCGVFGVGFLQSGEGRYEKVDLFKSKIQRDAESQQAIKKQEAAQLETARKQQEAEEQKAARRKAAAEKKAEVEEKQRKARMDLELGTGKKLFAEGHDALVQTNKIVPDISTALGYKPAQPVHVKSVVKSISDQIIDTTNEGSFKFDKTDSVTESNKKEHLAKKLLDFKENRVTTESIEAAYQARLTALKDSFTYEDYQPDKKATTEGIIEISQQRLEAAKKYLIESLETKKAASDLQISDFVSVRSESVRENKPADKPAGISAFKKTITDLIDKIVSFFKKEIKNPSTGTGPVGKKEASPDINKLFSLVLDSRKNETESRTNDVENVFKQMKKKEPEVAAILREKIKKFSEEKSLTPGISTTEKNNIINIGKRWIDSLEPEQKQDTDDGYGNYKNIGW